ncbi:MAG: ZIP family metal transporter [Firmicutes bacterium]|nr:ZIP family metal transporter [Bacillota bacterium]
MEGAWAAALVAALIAGAANLVGGGVVALRREPGGGLKNLVALSAGFLVAVAVIDLIPEGLEDAPGNSIFILAGFALVYFLHVGVAGDFHQHSYPHPHIHPDPDQNMRSEPGEGDQPPVHGRSASTAGVALLAMLLHTFFDGVSIAAGFEVGKRIGWLVFAAVLLHKIPDGLTAASLLLRDGYGRTAALAGSAALGVSTVAGTILVSLTGLAEGGLARSLLALSGGIFLYVAASDLLPEVARSRDRGAALMVLLGMILFYVGSLALSGLGILAFN